eukprot:IDg5687t1
MRILCLKFKLSKKTSINSMLAALDKMHKDVGNSLVRNRKQVIDRHNAKTHVNKYNPTVGDYVVVARTQGPRTKMSANWVGPRRVVRVMSGFTAEVEHLLTKDTTVVHVCRLKPYSDALVGSEVSCKRLPSSQIASGDSWEPLATIFEDVPTKVKAFFNKKRSNAMNRRACSSIGI